MSGRSAIHTGLLLLALGAQTALADGPSFWTDNSRADFLKGRADGVSILEDETLALSPELKTLSTLGEPVVWSLVADKSGRVWAGTGHDGKLLRLEASGDTVLVQRFAEPEVSALAPAPGGGVFAATSPDGRIYRVSGDGKTAEPWFDPPEKYIWALLAAPGGELYAAAGPSGVVYRISGRDQARTVLKSDDQHIITLALDHSGNLLAGSSGKALLYQVTPAGAVSILYDSQMKDIRAILVDHDNNLYVSAFTMQSPGEQPSPLLPPQDGRSSGQSSNGAVEQKEDAPTQDQDKQSGTQIIIQAPMLQMGESASSEIYFFDADRFPTRIWQGSGETVLSMGLDREQNRVLFVSTKDKSNLCRVDRLGDQALVCPFPDDQATVFLRDEAGGRTLIATSNMGKLIALPDRYRAEGTFQSQVYNAGLPAEWGAITWKGDSPAGTQVRFRTRSGNTSRPDTTWSAWSTPYSPGSGARIESPARMYFQWEAQLSSSRAGASPAVEEVSVSYLRRNRPPMLSRIKLLTQGVFIRKSNSSTSASELTIIEMPEEAEQLVNPKKNSGTTSNPFSGKKEYSRGMRMAGWNASDANGDELRYSVYFRGVDETVWKPLALGLSDNAVTWNTESMADGWYVLRVVATDSTDNPGERAAQSERDSERFLVDNTPPVVEKATLSRSGTRAAVLQFEVADAVGRITQAQVSLDGERWRTVFPQDGIADTPRESYRLEFGDLVAGEHTVAVQVLDEFHNPVTFSRSIKLP